MIEITTVMVKDLIKAQFPQWAGLDIRPVEKSGHDNRTYHLGDRMIIRLPSGYSICSAGRERDEVVTAFEAISYDSNPRTDC